MAGNPYVILCMRISDMLVPSAPSVGRKCSMCELGVWVGRQVVKREDSPRFAGYVCMKCAPKVQKESGTPFEVEPWNVKEWDSIQSRLNPEERVRARKMHVLMTGKPPPDDA